MPQTQRIRHFPMRVLDLASKRLRMATCCSKKKKKEKSTSIATLAAGQQVIFAGQAISAPYSTVGVVVDGRTIEMAMKATRTSPLAVYELAGALIASEGGSAIILSPGEQPTFAQHTFSAAAASGMVVLDGTQTTVASADLFLAVYESAGVLMAG